MSSIYFYHDSTTEFDRLFEDALAARFCPRACAFATEAGQAAAQQRNTYRPRLDLHESKDTNTVTVTIELPGLISEDIAIDFHQNRLTVSGEPHIQVPDSQLDGSYTVRERRSGKFSRTLQLPLGTKPEDIKAKMENGVLTITFPKTSPEQQPKRIVIQ